MSRAVEKLTKTEETQILEYQCLVGDKKLCAHNKIYSDLAFLKAQKSPHNIFLTDLTNQFTVFQNRKATNLQG